MVMFNQESIARMQQKVLLQTPKKAERLAKYKPSKTHQRNKYTPKLSKERLQELRKLVGSPRLKNKSGKPTTTDPERIADIKKRQSINAILHRVAKQNTAITRQTALDLFELLPDLFENDPFWNKWKTMVLDERNRMGTGNRHQAASVHHRSVRSHHPTCVYHGHRSGVCYL